MPLSDVAIRLRKLREYLGYSQRDLAEEFQVTSGAIAHWESGSRPIPGPIVKLISIYESSFKVVDGVESNISEEDLEKSREILRQLVKALTAEGILLDENTNRDLKEFVESFFKDNFSQDRVRASIKVAFLRQVIKSLEGTRGLALKVAQMASFLELGLPLELPHFLGDLQMKGKPLSFPQINEILNGAYGEPGNIFSSIQTEPLAVTSLAQIHRARLLSGEDVVLKIQHPAIDKILQGQFKKLSLVSYLGSITGAAVGKLLEEVQAEVFLELDYEREVQSQERFRNIFAHETRIVIPKTYRELCRKNIIVSQFEKGLSFASFRERASAREKSQASLLIAYFHSYAVMQGGALYGDSHPGNFLFRNNEVVFLDFGRVIELNAEEVELERTLYKAILHKNKLKVFEQFRQRDLLTDPEKFDFEGFWKVLMQQQAHHLNEGSFKFDRHYLRLGVLAARDFKHRHMIKPDKSLLRGALVNSSLAGIFADLEAEANWRAQALNILSMR